MSARRMTQRLVGASAAGVATVFAVAPFAHADPATPQDSVSPTAPGGSADGTAKSGTKQVAPQGQVTPLFGIRKVRLGVQIKDGSWVPPGTDTGNTKISFVETGPHAAQAAADNGTSCRTVEGSEDPGSTETYCEINHQIPQASRQITPDAPGLEVAYVVEAGDTVTFTQTTVNKGLVIDSRSQTVGPCVLEQPPGGSQYPLCPNQLEDVVFTDPGLPPQAVDNHATVVSGHSVVINVLNNDITHGAPAKIVSTTHAQHGQVLIAVGQAAASQTGSNAKAPGDATYSIDYKSRAPYVGPDKFHYTMSTPNGKSTATVFITVIAPPPTAVNDSATTDENTAVTIDVLNNDDANGGGKLSIQSVGTPRHGTATISNGEVVYTPDAGFIGTDTFPYTNATQFGTANAVVTVTITGSGLAATGSSSHNLANLGMLLLITGGAATVVGRRRYRARHLGSR